QGERAADGRQRHVGENEQSPFEGAEHRVENDKNQQDGQGHNDKEPLLGALLALVFTFPINVVPPWQLNLRAYLLNCFLDGSAEVPAPYAVLDGNITLVALTVDFRSAVAFFDFAELRERYAFPGWR